MTKVFIWASNNTGISHMALLYIVKNVIDTIS